MTEQICPICGEVPEEGIMHGGWLMCHSHAVYVKPAKFDSYCHHCLGPIYENDEVLMCPQDNERGKTTWTVIHPKNECRGKATVNSTGDSSTYSTLFLTSDAPPEVIRAAYKALSFLHHPDRGGDMIKMQELNAAMQKISK